RREQRAEDRRHRLRRELVDAAIEVARDVPRVAIGVALEMLPELAVGHAADLRGERTPLRELGMSRSFEATRLEIRRLVEREQRILRLLRHAMDDLLNDG